MKQATTTLYMQTILSLSNSVINSLILHRPTFFTLQVMRWVCGEEVGHHKHAALRIAYQIYHYLLVDIVLGVHF